MVFLKYLGWVRNHCMEVFHYCAAVLRDRNIFVTCSDQILNAQRNSRSGAIYNDFENDPLEIMSMPSAPTEAHSLSPPVTRIQVSENEMDCFFLQADEDDPSRYAIEHEWFSTENTKSRSYRGKVCKIIENWDDMDIYKDNVDRY